MRAGLFFYPDVLKGLYVVCLYIDSLTGVRGQVGIDKLDDYIVKKEWPVHILFLMSLDST